MAGALRMRGELFALFLLVSGLGCIVAWAVCQWAVAVRAYRLRRASDAIKMHLIKGGRIPDGATSSLARDHFDLCALLRQCFPGADGRGAPGGVEGGKTFDGEEYRSGDQEPAPELLLIF